MARTSLCPDIAAARTSARFSPGRGREHTRPEATLGADETVEAMEQARHQGCSGTAVRSDTRLLCDPKKINFT